MTLRTDLFRTVDREVTKYIAVRDTITRPDKAKDMTIQRLDELHCLNGKFGVGYHFLVLLDGTTEVGRKETTIGAHSRNFDAISVSIGVVGGVDEEGNRCNTRTPEQLEAIKYLVETLQHTYPNAEVHDNP